MGPIVTYKGRQYRLLWSGKTKYGQRCKLSFMDGTKEFWADSSLVDGVGVSSGSGSGRTQACAECGRPGHLVADLEDGLLKHRECCDIEP